LSINLSGFINLFRLTGTLANPSLGVSSEEVLNSIGKTGFAVLTGSAGVAKLFIAGSAGSEDPCAIALKIAAKGPVPSKSENDKKKEAKKSIEKKAKGVGNKILDVFT
jgi:hypothetical protein